MPRIDARDRSASRRRLVPLGVRGRPAHRAPGTGRYLSMQPVRRIRAPRRIGLALAAVGAGALIVGTVAPAGAFSPFDAFTVNRLVSDEANVATHQDTNLVNGWGIAASPTSPWWVSN